MIYDLRITASFSSPREETNRKEIENPFVNLPIFNKIENRFATSEEIANRKSFILALL